jgi:hypothetical protein
LNSIFSSYVVGNVLVYVEFTGATVISLPIRQRVFGGLLAIGAAGVLVFVFGTRAVTEKDSSTHDENSKDLTAPNGSVPSLTNSCQRPWRAFVSAVKLLFTKDMALLSVTCFYTGIEMGFLSGVYSTALGFTEAFGEDRAKYVGVSGILIGVGEICGEYNI